MLQAEGADAPVAVLTRASIRPHKAMSFWRRAPGTERALAEEQLREREQELRAAKEAAERALRAGQTYGFDIAYEPRVVRAAG